MRTLLLTMTGVGFTLGVVFGLLLQLPIDNTMPATSTHSKNNRLSGISTFRSRRSLSEDKLRLQHLQQQQQDTQLSYVDFQTITSKHGVFSVPSTVQNVISLVEQKLAPTTSNPFSVSERDGVISETAPIQSPRVDSIKSTGTDERKLLNKNAGIFIPPGRTQEGNAASLEFEIESQKKDAGTSDRKNINVNNSPNASRIVSLKLNTHRNSFISLESTESLKQTSLEDSSYIASIVTGIMWTSRLEKSCPKPFQSTEAEAWRKRAEGLDVVKMEEGCGRMQNRLVTFRDASKACVRYRINTDQIQGEIYSYYLARLFNMSNIPPSMLARVDALSPKWRNVHLTLSMAQWADSKLVVLTQHINQLSPAHIPVEFREEERRFDPTLKNLAFKSHSELCQLVQWSDLIVFDYLTANLDRVINNMFNRQWNDQMMSSPAHNLEQRPDGGLVFLDNESGLFHGYRLLDKYSAFHTSLLHALCVFRESTVKTIKRLHESSSVGEELHKLFASNEVLHKQLPPMTAKNVKILQHRLNDVFQQITNCEHLFNR